MDIINQKISGKEVVALDVPKDETPVVDIMDALKKSIEEAKLKKGA